MNRTRPAMRPVTMSRTLAHGAALLALSLVAAHAQAADKAAGQAKHEAVCAACHGKDANTPIDPSYPKLAGQHRDFLERALADYKSGARKNAIMAGQVANLSEADMRDLAAWFSSQSGLAVKY